MAVRVVEIKENYLLKNLTTFRVGGKARFFAEVRKKGDLEKVLDFAKNRELPVLVLGGGSNVVVSEKGFFGLVVRMMNKGRTIIKEDKNNVWLKLEAGEVWDEVVKMAVEKGWWGIENLSHIPGSCGATVVQNVGAYGQQVSEVVVRVEAWDKINGRVVELSGRECRFDYRKSIFNRERRGEMVVLAVVIRLSKKGRPNLKYADLKEYFWKRQIKNPSLEQIRQAVIEIREWKYPYPVAAKGGSSGSFFKNIVLEKDRFLELIRVLEQNFPKEKVDSLLKLARKGKGRIKVPSAALIDMCGLKKMKVKGVYVNPNQPLVLINNGRATAGEVMELFRIIRREVFRKTRVVLENEPELVGFSQKELEYYFSLE